MSTVRFYSMPGALGTGDYPIFTENQDLSAYLVHTLTDCKTTKDILQTVGPVAMFDDYDTVNMAEIGGEWYWVTAWTTQSLQYEAVSFGLVYAAPTSLLKMGQTIGGVWKRTPYRTRDYMTAVISNDAMKMSRKIELPSINDDAVIYDPEHIKYFWCEIVGLTEDTGGEGKVMVQRGFFVAKDIATGKSIRTYNRYNSGSGWEYYRYPSIDELYNDDTILGIYADEVVQISISERCPYNVVSTAHAADDTGAFVTLATPEGVWINALYAGSGSSRRMFYNMMGITDDKMQASTLTYTLTDDERLVGSVRVINESGSAVATLPVQYGASVEITVQAIDDLTGMYTMLSIGDRVLTTIPEGHLGWIGSAWTEYQGRQMDSDRQMASFAVDQVNIDLELQLRQSQANQNFKQIDYAANSVQLFNPTAAIGAVLGIAEAGIQGRLERSAMTAKASMEARSIELQQQLKEKQMLNEPGNAYSMGYGEIYLTNCIKHPSRVQIEMPANITAQYIEDYMGEIGWPSEGKMSIEVTPGFVQGQLEPDIGIYGAKLENLIEAFGRGFKIKEVQS